MHVLQVNKFFFSNAGAETVFLGTRRLLQRSGHTVIDFAMHDERNLPSEYSDTFAPARYYERAGRGRAALARDALSSVYSFEARRALRRLLARARPDVAHLHNIYHQLTLSIVDELWTARVPVVLTIHDPKPVCPSYTLFTEGAPCRRCVNGSVLNAVVHRCVKGSRPASALAALETAIARRRRTYERVTTFIAPSRFMASVLAEGGVGSGRARVLPNFLDPPAPPATAPVERRDYLFVGRLEQTKGVRTLLRAFVEGPGEARLKVVGDGPLAPEVEKAARSGRVLALGPQPPGDVARLLDETSALIVPSIIEENCPMVVLEARAHRAPVLCSDRGGLPELVSDGVDGLVFPAGDAAALRRCVQHVEDDPRRAGEFAERGYDRLVREHSSRRYYERLVAVYEEAIQTAPSMYAAG